MLDEKKPKRKILQSLPLILLAGAIALSPSFSAGRLGIGKVIELRVEDFLILILGLIWIANFLISGRKKLEKPPLFLPILVWLGVGFVSLLTNWLFANLDFDQGFFYFLKEIEFFFLFFYLFYHLKGIRSAKFIMGLWIFLALISISWIVYEAITGLKITYSYAPTSFIEPRGSFPNAGFFVIIFLFLFNVFLFNYLKSDMSKLKKVVLGLAVVSIAISPIISGSRASFWGLCFGLILTFSLYFLREKKLKSFLIAILVIGFLFLVFLRFYPTISGTKRSIQIGAMIEELTLDKGAMRFAIFKINLEKILSRPLFTIFGFGVTGEAHSQYMRIFLERGLVGLFVFFFLIFVIMKRGAQGFLRGRDPFLVGMSGGLLAATSAMLLMSITNDPFMVVKIAEVYWFFAALTLAVLTFKKKKINKQKYGLS